MNIVILDDAVTTLRYLEDVIDEHYCGQHKVLSFSDPDEMLRFSGNADLLLADIKIGDKNGIELAKEFSAVRPETKVIFITGYPTEYFEDIFKGIRPFGYIGKPINEELLFKHIDNAVSLLNNKKHLIFSYNNARIALPLKDIQYIESRKSAKVIVTKTDKYKVNLTFEEIERQLSGGFLRCHKSYIINSDCISGFENHKLLLDDGAALPIGRQFKAQIKKEFFCLKGELA